MIEFRSFRNTDAPLLADVWQSQPPHRGLMQPMSAAILDRFVLSKPIFDRQGLIVAAEGDRLLGFAHAGFGPTADQQGMSTDIGVISLVLVRPDADAAISGELVTRCEQYLRDRGARNLHGGGCFPFAPFYYGLYGGGEISGVLESDTRMQRVFREQGYKAASRSLVLHRELAGFRPLVDRQQLLIRRRHRVEMVPDPPTTTWWEACLFEPFDRTRCVLLANEGGPPAASVNFWNMETFVGAWGVQAAGVADLVVTGQRRQGLAKFLLGEALRHLHGYGVALVEVHVAQDNQAALGLFGSLGFTPVDASVLFRKVADGPDDDSALAVDMRRRATNLDD